MIPVTYIPTEYRLVAWWWECQHVSTFKDHVTVNYDDSELVTICDSCDAQLIGEEFLNE